MPTRHGLTARRTRRRLERESTRVTLRFYSRLDGPEPAPNPPRVSGLVVHGTQGPGGATLVVRGTPLVGRFIAGDELLVGAYRFGVAATAADNGANQATITLTFPLPATLADGAAITPVWSADREVGAEVTAMTRSLMEGIAVEQRDLSVLVAAEGLPRAPAAQDRITLPDGDSRTIVAVVPLLVEGLPVSYRLQVR